MNNVIITLSNFAEDIKDSVLQGIYIAIIIGGILCICAIIFLFTKLGKQSTDGKKTKPSVSIILSTILGCIFMIPITVAFSNLVVMRVKNQIRNTKEAELKAITLQVENKQLEKENLEKQNKIIEQTIAMNSLKNEVALLKAAQASVMQFQKIAEVALIKTNLQQTKAWYEPTSDVETGFGIRADFYQDGVLVVNTYDIDAKFGIDFNAIKIKKISDSSIQVSGISPIYIGAEKIQKQNIISEIRREDYDSNGDIKRTTIKNDTTSLNLAHNYENAFDRDYQTSFRKMETWSSIADSVTMLGQNFVKLVLSPVYKEIIFGEEDMEDGLPIISYIETEIQNGEKQAEELSGVMSALIEAESEQQAEDEQVESDS